MKSVFYSQQMNCIRRSTHDLDNTLTVELLWSKSKNGGIRSKPEMDGVWSKSQKDGEWSMTEKGGVRSARERRCVV